MRNLKKISRRSKVELLKVFPKGPMWILKEYIPKNENHFSELFQKEIFKEYFQKDQRGFKTNIFLGLTKILKKILF